MTSVSTKIRSRILSTMTLTMSRLLMFIIRELDVLDVSEAEKLSHESGLAFGRGLDLSLDL